MGIPEPKAERQTAILTIADATGVPWRHLECLSHADTMAIAQAIGGKPKMVGELAELLKRLRRQSHLDMYERDEIDALLAKLPEGAG